MSTVSPTITPTVFGTVISQLSFGAGIAAVANVFTVVEPVDIVPNDTYGVTAILGTITPSTLGDSEFGPELAVNGTFDNNIAGYELRGNSTISFDATESALLCNVIAYGGGFLTTLAANTAWQKTYRVSLDIKDKTYGGGFKVRMGGVEVILASSINPYWETYTVDITAVGADDGLEIMRSETDTGEVLFDNLSIVEAISIAPAINALMVDTLDDMLLVLESPPLTSPVVLLHPTAITFVNTSGDGLVWEAGVPGSYLEFKTASDISGSVQLDWLQ